MTAAAVLDTLARHGVRAYRIGPDTVRLVPPALVTPELVALVKAQKPALLPVLPLLPTPAPPPVDYRSTYTVTTALTGTAEDFAACSWFYELGNRGLPVELTALERRCEELAATNAPDLEYHSAVEELVGRIRDIRELYREAQRRRAAEDADADVGAAPQPVWRVVIDRTEPVLGPVRLDGCTVVEDVPRFVAATMCDLELAVAHRNGGRETCFTRLGDEYVAQLAACGCIVRVETVH